MSRPFAARFLGACPECVGDIDPGQLIRYDDDDRLVHDDCAAAEAAAAAPTRPEVVCPSCWLGHAGECT